MSKPDPMKPETCVGRWVVDTGMYQPSPPTKWMHALKILERDGHGVFIVVDGNGTVNTWGRDEWWALTEDTERVMPAGWTPGDPIPSEVPELPEGWEWGRDPEGCLQASGADDVDVTVHDGEVWTELRDGGRRFPTGAPIAVVKAVIARWEAENG